MVNKDKTVILFVGSFDRRKGGRAEGGYWGRVPARLLSLPWMTHPLMVHSCIWNGCQQRAEDFLQPQDVLP